PATPVERLTVRLPAARVRPVETTVAAASDAPEVMPQRPVPVGGMIWEIVRPEIVDVFDPARMSRPPPEMCPRCKAPPTLSVIVELSNFDPIVTAPVDAETVTGSVTATLVTPLPPPPEQSRTVPVNEQCAPSVISLGAAAPAPGFPSSVAAVSFWIFA